MGSASCSRPWLAWALLLALASPAWAQSEARIVLRWSAVASATAYDLQIATDDDFRHLVLETRVPTAGYRWPVLPMARHFWRVRSIDAAGRAGEWSAAQQIEPAVAPPRQVSPEDGAQVPFDPAGLTFVGEPLPTLTRLVVELSRDPSSGQWSREEGPGTGRTVPALALGAWSWRLRGIDVNGQLTEPTPIRSLTVLPDAPRILQPTGEVELPRAQGSSVRLQWSCLSPARRFRVEIHPEAGVLVGTETSERSFTFAPTGPGRVRITVRGLEGDLVGPPSAPVLISIGAPAPALVSPEDGAVIPSAGPSADVELLWRPKAGDATVEVAHEPAFEEPIATRRTSADRWHPPPLEPGLYWWRITTRDRATRRLVHSQVWSFRVASPAASGSVPPTSAAAAPPSASPPTHWMIGVSAGGFTTLGALSGPIVEVEATSVLPVWGGRLRVSGRVGSRQARFDTLLPPDRTPVTGSAWLPQLTLVALFAQPFGEWTLAGGAGVLGQLAEVRVPNQLAALQPVVGVEGLVAVSRRLGPGELSVELGAGLAELRTPDVHARTAGLSATLGYRVQVR